MNYNLTNKPNFMSLDMNANESDAQTTTQTKDSKIEILNKNATCELFSKGH